MKKLRSGLVAVAMMAGLLSCTNNGDPAGSTEATPVNTIETKPIDTVIKKTIIVDVRTVEEWVDDGHASCSVNYPLSELDKKLAALKAYDQVVVVCRSGSRAEVAKEMLEQAGIKHVENKGAWQNIDCK